MIRYLTAHAFVWMMVLSLFSGTQCCSSAHAQPKPLPGRPPTIGGHLQRKLLRLQNYLQNEQWDEYAQLMTELLDERSEGLVTVEGNRDERLLVSFTEHCQRLLSQAPAPAIESYRQLIDSRAEALYRLGLAQYDERALQRVADTMFCSSWGDDALWALGELALQRGDCLAARFAWQKLDTTHNGLSYPDSTSPQAEVQARLALVSISAGHTERAEREIQELSQRYPQARGTWGGREVNFAEELRSLLVSSQQWAAKPIEDNWLTLGGDFQRTRSLPNDYSAQLQQAWHFPLFAEASSPIPQAIFSNELAFVQDGDGIHALNLATGMDAFTATGEVFRRPITSITSCRDKLIGVSDEEIWAIDVARDGALAYRWEFEEKRERFAGAAVVDGTHLLLERRSHDQFARAGIVCFDLATRQFVWKRWVASAVLGGPPPGSAIAASPGVVYHCTNLGAVAAVRIADGHILWLRTYARSMPGQGIPNASSCMLVSGTLVALPNDSRQLLALDPTSGTILWTRSGIDPGGSLVGATRNRVVLNNNGLHVLDLGNGDVVASNFDITPTGQCLVAGDVVYVPTPQEIKRIDLTSGELLDLGIPWHGSPAFDLIGTREGLLAVGQTQLSMFQLQTDLEGILDGQQ